METDYISRDYAVENMENFPWDTEHDRNAAIHLVRELVPAADVRPVKKGRWIKDSDGLDICSECEEVALQRVFIKLPEKIVDLQMRRSNFCPNCGADMGGEGTDFSAPLKMTTGEGKP